MAYQTSGGLALPLNQQATERRSPEGSVSPALRAASRFPKPPVSAEQILKSFNTRSFKREQPDNPELMLRVIADSIAKHQPIPFTMYWGKGLRPVLAAPENKCLDYLASMLARVADCYGPGAKMTLVFTDTHASLNGHSPESIGTYFDSLTAAAEQRGFAVQKLSPLITAADLPAIDESASAIPPEEVLAGLLPSAAKWFRGEGTSEEGAVRYYQANMIEKQVIDRAFPNTIFVTFNGHQLRSLFPETLPIFYMYSVRHGVSDKPWFLPPDFAGAAPANASHLTLV
jgi:hypothetical protein